MMDMVDISKTEGFLAIKVRHIEPTTKSHAEAFLELTSACQGLWHIPFYFSLSSFICLPGPCFTKVSAARLIMDLFLFCNTFGDSSGKIMTIDRRSPKCCRALCVKPLHTIDRCIANVSGNSYIFLWCFFPSKSRRAISQLLSMCRCMYV